VKHVTLNAAFHHLVDNGLPTERAWLKLIRAVFAGDLRLWCDGTELSLDYIVNHLRISIYEGSLIVMPAGPLGWEKPASEYTFTIDAVGFERLLVGRSRGRPKTKLTAKEIKGELNRRRRGGLPTNQIALAAHFGTSPQTIRRRRRLQK
jgi:hypothetical protein